MSESLSSATENSKRSLHENAVQPTQWLLDHLRSTLGETLVAAAVYGPAVTDIFDTRQHRIHVLVVLTHRCVDRLLELAKISREATKRKIAPPLITCEESMHSSRDVFPLEWLDIDDFHKVIHGQIDLEAELDPEMIRLQCERDLRSMDIQLLRGVLASGGRPRRIDRLEREASDMLIRILRGIVWLGGSRRPLLPDQLCDRCESLVGDGLPGCREAIATGGRHDMETFKQLVDEVVRLSQFVDGMSAGETAPR